ncbi:hypothetical protein LXL04_003914 [Taraxacum kok-saghyz]
MLTWMKAKGCALSKGSDTCRVADEYGIRLFETTAKTFMNVEEVFFSIIRDIKQRFAETKQRLRYVVYGRSLNREKTNANGASLVLGWQKRHMKKNGQWINQKAEEDFTSADDPSSVDEAMVLRNALGEGRCHNRGVGRKLKCVSRYPQPSQPTNQGTSSTTTIATMEEKMVGMQQVMGMMYYNMQQMQQALCAQNPNYQPAVQFSDPTLSAQNLNFQQMMMQFNEHARGLHELRDEETTSDDE